MSFYNRLLLAIKKNIFLFVFFTHILIIFLVCLKSTVHTMNTSFFTKNNDKKTILEKDISSLIQNPIIHFYTDYSGIGSPYGYFAPNVASSYIIKFNSVDSSGKKVSSVILPPFKQVESINRYSALLGFFQETLKSLKNPSKQIKDSLKLRYLDVIIKAMNKSLLRKASQNVDTIRSTLFLYDQPTIYSFLLGDRKPKLVIMKKFITKKQ